MTVDTPTLLQKIEIAAQGLLFPSESDFPIEPFVYGDQEPTPEELRKRQGLGPDVPIEETTLASLFEGLVEAEEDASEREQASAQRFCHLMKLLAENLECVRVYRIGEVDIEVLVIGRDASGTWLGIKTNVVET